MLKLYRILFWLTVAVVLFLALDPHPPSVPGSDKIHHAAAFAVMFVGATLAYPTARLLPLAAAMSGFGALIEFLQAIPIFGRDCDWKDWVADTGAVLLALVLVLAARTLLQVPADGNLQS